MRRTSCLRWGSLITALSIATLAVSAIAVRAGAQTPADPLEACSQMSDGPARLACFDQEMQRRRGTTAAAPRPVAAPADASGEAPGRAAGNAAANTGGNAGADSRGNPAAAPIPVAPPSASRPAGARPVEQGVVQGAQSSGGSADPAPRPFAARVTQPVLHPDNRYTFVLDNGQVWEQVDARTGLFVDPNEPVTIRPGVLGSFFLKTSGGQVLRVRRVR